MSINDIYISNINRHFISFSFTFQIATLVYFCKSLSFAIILLPIILIPNLQSSKAMSSHICLVIHFMRNNAIKQILVLLESWILYRYVTSRFLISIRNSRQTKNEPIHAAGATPAWSVLCELKIIKTSEEMMIRDIKNKKSLRRIKDL